MGYNFEEVKKNLDKLLIKEQGELKNLWLAQEFVDRFFKETGWIEAVNLNSGLVNYLWKDYDNLWIFNSNVKGRMARELSNCLDYSKGHWDRFMQKPEYKKSIFDSLWNTITNLKNSDLSSGKSDFIKIDYHELESKTELKEALKSMGMYGSELLCRMNPNKTFQEKASLEPQTLEIIIET